MSLSTHQFKNSLANLTSSLDQIALGMIPNMGLDEMKKLVGLLRLKSKYLLHLSVNLEDEALIRKTHLFLSMSQVFIEEVNDFDSLRPSEVKDFQDLISIVGRLDSLLNPNSITYMFSKP